MDNMTTKVICFDTPKKCKLFAKYMGSCKTVDIFYSYSADETLKRMLRNKPDIVLLGGDVESGYKAAALFHMMEEWDINKKICLYITTWDADEAKIIKDMTPKSMYVPLCESVAKIVKERSKQIRVRKKKKLSQNS